MEQTKPTKHGGARTPGEGKKIGRPPTGRKPVCLYLSSDEYDKVQALLVRIRSVKPSAKK